MSKFLIVPDKALTPLYIHRTSTTYFLEKYRDHCRFFVNYPNGNSKGKEELLAQNLIKYAGHRLRMYGSAAELAESLEFYGKFTGSHIFFNATNEPYQLDPIIYRSLNNNQEYICNTDIFAILQNILLHINMRCPDEATHMVAYYMKSLETDIKMQFMRFDPKLFDEIEKELRVEMAKSKPNDAEIIAGVEEFSDMDFDECLRKLKSLLPRNVWNLMRNVRMHTLFERTGGRLTSLLPNLAFLAFNEAERAIKSLKTLMKKRPELFLPRETEKVVRLFEDEDGERFVMKAELSNSLGTRLDSEDDPNTHFTMNMDDVLRRFGDEKIELLHYQIRRAKHRAVPVKGIGSTTDQHDFFILAVDAFFDLMKDLIIGVRVFQDKSFGKFSLGFHELEKIFKPNCTEPYFIKTQAIEQLREFIVIATDHDEDDQATMIRNAKPDGFTLQNLKNELNHLGLKEAFPEIEEHAEVVYEHVDRCKKEKYLRTCDLFDAVEKCQLLCIINRVPNFKRFIHNQKGCARVPGLKCDKCEKETSGIQNSMENLQIKGNEKEKELKKREDEMNRLKEELNREKERLNLEKEKNKMLQAELFKLKAEDLGNAVIQQLLNGFADTSTSNQKEDSPTTSYIPIKCLICSTKIRSPTVNNIGCPSCKKRFHANCVVFWQHCHQLCPACNGENMSNFK
ncbi:hypothetical protein GCK72_002793 [Caenorhabditis remanei]|uniref:RING-type domain-containing protein n=1 Tax=Caenorhabditis remanei TaxID=31234 RepID=A0A6A5HTA4_CAERE|nr:hypothetical protein GCK72_002793 [Caenorhabditis remanei]KAF1770969.1 hypothetical protein GCK72_002793 [Caenorhabditis remanei]